MLLLAPHGWPRKLLLGVPCSYEVISPSDLKFAPVIPHTTSLFAVAQGQAQLFERGPGFTFAIVTRETHLHCRWFWWQFQQIRHFLNFLQNKVRPNVSWAKFPDNEFRNSFGWQHF